MAESRRTTPASATSPGHSSRSLAVLLLAVGAGRLPRPQRRVRRRRGGRVRPRHRRRMVGHHEAGPAPLVGIVGHGRGLGRPGHRLVRSGRRGLGVLRPGAHVPRTACHAVVAARAAWLRASGLPPAGTYTAPRRPSHPVLLCNPWSGGGKVEKFGLVELARSLGVETVMLDHGLDLAELARDAIARGADCLGMAGGDGSQALVASLAVEHDLPFVVRRPQGRGTTSPSTSGWTARTLARACTPFEMPSSAGSTTRP